TVSGPRLHRRQPPGVVAPPQERRPPCARTRIVSRPMYALLLRLMFLIPPERVHHLVFATLRFATWFPPTRWLVRKLTVVEDPILATTAFGVDFAAPLGLAAGFDKNADGANTWGSLGFGFAE